MGYNPEAPYSIKHDGSIPENSSVAYMYSLLEYNLSLNFPAVEMIRINNPANYQFTYTTRGHFVVICGTYTSPISEPRVVIADPYPTSDPDFVELKPGDTHPMAYAFLDCSVQDLRALIKDRSLICGKYNNS